MHRRPGRGHDPLHGGRRRDRHHLDGHHPDVRVPGGRPRLPVRGGSAGCRTGVAAALAAAAAAGKLRVLDFSLDPRCPSRSWPGVVGGAFLTLATHGTDHYLVQRLLVARSRRTPRVGLVALRLPGPGAVRAVPPAGHAALGPLRRPALRARDEVLPTFAATELPGGWTGFILAAIVAAALSPSLNSMASATVRDFYLPYFRPRADEARADAGRPRLHGGLGRRPDGRGASLAQNMDSALQAGPRRAELRLGPDRRRVPPRDPTRTATTAGRSIGHDRRASPAASPSGCSRPSCSVRPGVAWTWNVAVGAITTFVVGLAASRLRPAPTA